MSENVSLNFGIINLNLGSHPITEAVAYGAGAVAVGCALYVMFGKHDRAGFQIGLTCAGIASLASILNAFGV